MRPECGLRKDHGIRRVAEGLCLRGSAAAAVRVWPRVRDLLRVRQRPGFEGVPHLFVQEPERRTDLPARKVRGGDAEGSELFVR